MLLETCWQSKGVELGRSFARGGDEFFQSKLAGPFIAIEYSDGALVINDDLQVIGNTLEDYSYGVLNRRR
jgi:hypothetical protein